MPPSPDGATSPLSAHPAVSYTVSLIMSLVRMGRDVASANASVRCDFPAHGGPLTRTSTGGRPAEELWLTVDNTAESHTQLARQGWEGEVPWAPHDREHAWRDSNPRHLVPKTSALIH